MTNSSKSLGTYRDVEPYLKRAVAGSITLKFEHPKDALQFVARANKFRKLYREDQKERGRAYESPYDFLMIRHPIDPATSKRGETVIIESRTTTVQVLDEQGREVYVEPVGNIDQDQDDFLKEIMGSGALRLHVSGD